MKNATSPGGNRQPHAILLSLRVGLGFALFSVLWIVLSDRLILALDLPADILALVGTGKGIAYVAVVGTAIFWISYRQNLHAERMRQRNTALEVAVDRATGTVGNWTFRMTADGRGIETGPGIASLLGLSSGAPPVRVDDLMRKVHPDSVAELAAAFDPTEDQSTRATILLHTASDRWRWLQVQAVRLHGDATTPGAVVGSMTDVTDVRMATERAERSASLMRALLRISRAAAEADSRMHLFGEVCTALVAETDARIAWVGIPEPAGNRTISVAYSAGADKAFLVGRPFSWADGAGSGPVGRAVRSQTIQVSADINSDPDCVTWQPDAAGYGFVSCVAAPVIENSRVIAVAVVHGRIPAGMDRAARDMVGAVGRELGRALAQLAQRDSLGAAVQAHRLALEDLEHAREAAAGTIARAVEQQSPYRAGHQNRVARLAEAIAEKCGMPPAERRDAFLGGLIHDVGIGRVPGEILSRPGPLSAEEFAIVRTHPAEGGRIIASLGLSPAVRDAVRHHHERLDGSGYPDRLKGDEISRVVRVVAVADMAEAMLSTRPYRPALALHEVRETLRRLRVSQLDPQAVDACLALLASGRPAFLDGPESTDTVASAGA